MGILEMKTAVNGLEWNIEYADDKALDSEGDGVVLGVTKFLEQKIYIRRGMSKELTRRTVIHELCHCFLFSLGFSSETFDEETVCNLFGNNGVRIIMITNEFMRAEER